MLGRTMNFADVLQGWHDFYVTAGAAAATLVGLLFVGLSLHIKVVVSQPDVRSLARVTRGRAEREASRYRTPLRVTKRGCLVWATR